MCDEADDIITSFGLSEQEMKSYETVRNRFENHFIAKRNVIFKRAKFNVRIQDENEAVEDFITDLHCLAKYWEFGVLKDQLIRDCIVVGLKNKKLFEKLQLDPELTLEKDMAQAGQNEEIKKQPSIIHGNKYTRSYEHNNIITSLRIENNTRVTKILMAENSTNPDARGVSDKCIPDNPALQVSPSVIIVQTRDPRIVQSFRHALRHEIFQLK